MEYTVNDEHKLSWQSIKHLAAIEKIVIFDGGHLAEISTTI